MLTARIKIRSNCPLETTTDSEYREGVVGRGGFEPPLTGPEPVVLPLNDLPIGREMLMNVAQPVKTSGCTVDRWGATIVA